MPIKPFLFAHPLGTAIEIAQVLYRCKFILQIFTLQFRPARAPIIRVRKRHVRQRIATIERRTPNRGHAASNRHFEARDNCKMQNSQSR